MRTIARILEAETEPRSSGSLNDLQSRALIGVIIVIILVIMYCLQLLATHLCDRSSTSCPNNLSMCRTRSSAYKRVLDSLPVKPYAFPSLGPDSDAEACAICLAKYEEGDSVRVLPRCNHFLHVECMDEWLLRSFKCPLCRALVTDHLNVDIHKNNYVYVCPPLTSIMSRSII